MTKKRNSPEDISEISRQKGGGRAKNSNIFWKNIARRFQYQIAKHEGISFT